MLFFIDRFNEFVCWFVFFDKVGDGSVLVGLFLMDICCVLGLVFFCCLGVGFFIILFLLLSVLVVLVVLGFNLIFCFLGEILIGLVFCGLVWVGGCGMGG